MIILIHTSKTMRAPSSWSGRLGTPALLDRATALAAHVASLPPRRLAEVMSISGALAERTHSLLAEWTTDPARQSPAVLSFTGDIYSGLQADTFTAAQRRYADAHLRILSGLYGILRPYDGICPYRLEMGYRLPGARYASLYRYWAGAIADCLPASGPIVNLAAAEYNRTVLPFVDADRVVTPKFLTADPKTGEPKFVVVHAKIARGTFARWLITAKPARLQRLVEFAEIGYAYDAAASTPREPVFVCAEFGGKGLSVRLR